MFSLNWVENCNKDSSTETHFKSSKTSRGSYFDVSSYVKIFNSVADPKPEGSETFGRIRNRSGNKRNVSDPDLNLDSIPDRLCGHCSLTVAVVFWKIEKIAVPQNFFLSQIALIRCYIVRMLWPRPWKPRPRIFRLSFGFYSLFTVLPAEHSEEIRNCFLTMHPNPAPEKIEIQID